MNSETEPVRIYVGAHESERLAFKVLEHSIKRHTRLPVEMYTIDNSLMPPPRDNRYLAYTNFSYGRFAIPSQAGYQGRAIYLDSDMIVFSDIAEIWELPFDGAKVMVERMTENTRDMVRVTAVMVMDCSALQWDPEQIMAGLGIDYSYDELMAVSPLLEEGEFKDRLPIGWNSLDTYDKESTRLLHYTRIKTQPWVYPDHPLGYLWIDELKLMLKDGGLSKQTVRDEVAAGHVRPSLLLELGLDNSRGKSWTPRKLLQFDYKAGYVIHEKKIADGVKKHRAHLDNERQVDPVGFRRRRRKRVWRKFYRHPIKFFTDPKMRW